MSDWLARFLLRSYPASWRAEYGSELEEVLSRRPFRIGIVFNVVWSGLTERMRQPFSRFAFYSLVGSVAAFFLSVMIAGPLWRMASAPVTAVLRAQGVDPPLLVQVSPWEGAEVVWLGILILLTVFITFAWMLVLAWVFFSGSKDALTRQWVIRLVPSSGILFALSSLSFVAWQHGSLATLLNVYPDQNAPLLSVGHCYLLLMLSTIGLTVLLQLPVLAFFGWRFMSVHGRHAE